MSLRSTVSGTSAYLPFHMANKKANNRLDQPSHCSFIAESATAFHVPAFQRNHRKRLAPFFWNALRVQLVLSPLDQRSSHCAKQASLMECVVSGRRRDR